MKIEIIGLENKASKITLSAYDLFRILDAHFSKHYIEDSNREYVIEARLAENAGHRVKIQRYSEDFRGRRPNKKAKEEA